MTVPQSWVCSVRTPGGGSREVRCSGSISMIRLARLALETSMECRRVRSSRPRTPLATRTSATATPKALSPSHAASSTLSRPPNPMGITGLWSALGAAAPSRAPNHEVRLGSGAAGGIWDPGVRGVRPDGSACGRGGGGISLVAAGPQGTCAGHGWDSDWGDFGNNLGDSGQNRRDGILSSRHRTWPCPEPPKTFYVTNVRNRFPSTDLPRGRHNITSSKK